MKKNNNIKIYLIIGILILVLIAGNFIQKKYTSKIDNSSVITNPKVEDQNHSTQPSNIEDQSQQAEEEQNIPLAYKIDNVPFQPQAPFANWDELHDEACEEAALIIAYYFIKDKNLTAEEMENQIQKMVSWEIENLGSHKDLTAQETTNLGKNFFGLNNIKVEDLDSIDQIKKEIAQDHLVIVPTAGRLLGNPYYRQPGPIYHMLVISGYNQNQIITQDIGTKRGQNYVYNEKILFNAIHDWNGSPESINSGQKIMMVITN